VTTRDIRMYNRNRFKLGLFSANCSANFATTAPECWQAGWDENVEAAKLADEAGLEFILPVARWVGYGGVTDRQGTTFETLTWASALLASTKEVCVFATVHVPLVNPVFAAKAMVTADHVGKGRFGLNLVSGWNLDEFAMFGATMREHDARYEYSTEWTEIIKRIWSDEKPFDYKGKFFDIKGVIGKPKPWGGGRPMLMSAGSSPAGRAFASKHVDCIFMPIGLEENVARDVAAIKALDASRSVGVYASGHILCRRTAKETRDYYHYLVHEKGDWEAARNIVDKREAGGSRSMEPGLLRSKLERVISGGATYPVIGSYDECAETFLRLSNAGLDGMALMMVNYVQEMPHMRDEVLPRLERLKLREARR
jgi:alkanesulfonate monooxygenase SsuD/methylene tetrahydromethanopterin reductase-like flavin-dependent oxidoreductase (luciferase family)